MSTLIVNDLRFEVRLSDRRRALEITVDRGGELILSAPPDVPDAKLRDFALRKRMWVYKQLARKEALGDQTPRRVFTDGEGFAYLGRNYTLRLVPESDAAVKLIGGRFVMPKALARWPSAPNPVVLPACPALVGRQGAARATSHARVLAAG